MDVPALIVRLTLFDDSRVLLIYPGNLDSCQALLRHLRRASRDALIDGVPYRQYWGEILSSSPDPPARSPVPATAFFAPKTRSRSSASTSV